MNSLECKFYGMSCGQATPSGLHPSPPQSSPSLRCPFFMSQQVWNLVDVIRGTGAVVKFTDKREAIFERQYYRVKVE